MLWIAKPRFDDMVSSPIVSIENRKKGIDNLTGKVAVETVGGAGMGPELCLQLVHGHKHTVIQVNLRIRDRTFAAPP